MKSSKEYDHFSFGENSAHFIVNFPERVDSLSMPSDEFILWRRKPVTF